MQEQTLGRHRVEADDQLHGHIERYFVPIIGHVRVTELPVDHSAEILECIDEQAQHRRRPLHPWIRDLTHTTPKRRPVEHSGCRTVVVREGRGRC
jgi:hypothetical protein